MPILRQTHTCPACHGQHVDGSRAARLCETRRHRATCPSCRGLFGRPANGAVLCDRCRLMEAWKRAAREHGTDSTEATAARDALDHFDGVVR